MVSKGQPSQQSRLCILQVHRGYANLGESKLRTPFLQLSEQCRLIDGHKNLLNEMPIVKTLHWPDEQACAAFAERLAMCPAFTRYLLQALGVKDRIKSPTYAVVEPYEVSANGNKLCIWHFDFYRFNDPREWEDAGFRDIFASLGLKICEWPDKSLGFLPLADLDIHFSVNLDGSRDVRLCANSELGEDLIA
jgi:tRNA threonylcarbamoyladenosine biosynthesis protein TsaE